MQITLNSGIAIGGGAPPYIVAEMNTSHFGDMALAREMILAAKRSGCDCVKFQSWSADTLYSQTYYDENPMAKRFVKKYALSPGQLEELSGFCAETGIGFSSTPYSEEEARFLVDRCRPAFLKVASMELNNLRYLRELARLDTAIVLSTGMGELPEIERAVNEMQQAGASRLCVLHCVSSYPAAPELIHLRNITTMQDRLTSVVIGYSDHTLGSAVASASIALGACLVEKHFTLDSGRIGMDNQMATEPGEMSRLVRDCHAVRAALGSRERTLGEEELRQRHHMRRSVVSARALAKGTELREEDLVLKRPGTGIPADRFETVIGRRLLQDVAADQVIPAELLA